MLKRTIIKLARELRYKTSLGRISFEAGGREGLGGIEDIKKSKTRSPHVLSTDLGGLGPSWKSLIKSSAFIQSHLRTTIASNNQNDSHLLLLLLSASSYNRDHTGARNQHHWLHWDSPESGEHCMLPTLVNLLENKPVSDLGVAGTSTHFMALAMMDILMTKIMRVVIAINNKSDLIGSAVALSPRFTTLVQVYSLPRGSWKSFSASVIHVDFKGGSGRPVFVDGTIHMLKARFTSSYYNDGDIVITTFNLATEEFGEMMGPEALLQKGCSISRYGDSLALIKHLNYEFRDQASIHGFKRSGEVVLEENIEEDIDLYRSRLMSLDPKSNQYLVLGTGDHSYYLMDSFVESLVLLDHYDSISYQVARAKDLLRCLEIVSGVVCASVLNFQFSTLDMEEVTAVLVTEDPRLLSLVKERKHIRSYNWGCFAFKKLLEEVKLYQTKKTDHVGGCLVFLQLFYLSIVGERMFIIPKSVPPGIWVTRRYSGVRSTVFSGSRDYSIRLKTNLVDDMFAMRSHISVAEENVGVLETTVHQMGPDILNLRDAMTSLYDSVVKLKERDVTCIVDDVLRAVESIECGHSGPMWIFIPIDDDVLDHWFLVVANITEDECEIWDNIPDLPAQQRRKNLVNGAMSLLGEIFSPHLRESDLPPSAFSSYSFTYPDTARDVPNKCDSGIFTIRHMQYYRERWFSNFNFGDERVRIALEIVNNPMNKCYKKVWDYVYCEEDEGRTYEELLQPRV
ncbi:hypothetical protein ACLB2K_072274 [Fragaria x ananassa]